MQRIIKTCTLALLACISLVSAQLSFYGYQRHDLTDTAYDYVERFLGTVSLKTSEITVTPRGCYLDIVEDAWLEPNLSQTNYANMSNEFFIKGSLPLPTGAAVTGMVTWKGPTMYRARLRLAQYSYNQTLEDSTSLEEFSDSRVIYLRQTSSETFELTMTKIDIGERKHVRIRYLLPNEVGGKARYSIPVLFNAPHASNPTVTKLHIAADSTKHPYTLESTAGIDRLTHAQALMVPFQATHPLSFANEVRTSLHRTSFPVGSGYDGYYAMVNASVDDELIGSLSSTIETVFLWRWNRPHDFIAYYNRVKTLSAYGDTVVAQARSLSRLIRTLLARGHRCALVHSIEGHAPVTFPLSALGDTTITTYLATFTAEYLYRTYPDNEPETAPWAPVPTGSITTYEAAEADLRSCVTSARTLFASSTVSSLEHLVVLSAGAVSSAYTSMSGEEFDTLCAGLTYDASRGAWRGIALPTSFANRFYTLTRWEGFYFPFFQPSTIHMQIRSTRVPFTYPLRADTNVTLAAVLKALTPFDSTITWTGYDDRGMQTGTVTTAPLKYNAVQDSGVAKLWAHTDGHGAEVEEDNPAVTYAILSRATYLQAQENDTASDGGLSIPYLSEEEVRARYGASVSARVRIRGAISWHLSRGTLHMTVASGSLSTMLVLDIRGRRVARIDLAPYARGGGRYAVPLNELLGRSAAGMLLIQLQGSSTNAAFKLAIGGAR